MVKKKKEEEKRFTGEHTLLDYNTPVMMALTVYGHTLSIFKGVTHKLSGFADTRARRFMLDSGLSFGNHVDVVCGKVWGALAGIYSTNTHLPFRIKRRLAHAFLMSWVLYCPEVVPVSSRVMLISLWHI
uniref:Uncharacterized protein n=1 Tax=Glossina pallidipes TaxID=7398 RepID=A0A1A9ZEW1_GLOPL